MTGGGAHVTAHLAAAAGLTSSSLTGVELWTMEQEQCWIL